MRLIAIKSTETLAQSIDFATDNGNRFANVNRFGELLIYGEDMKITRHEVDRVKVVTDNFDLFYTQLMRLQNEIQDLLTPTLSR